MRLKEGHRHVVGFLWVFGLLVPSVVFGEAGDFTKGEKVFKNFCVICHGPQGKGDGPLAKGLTPRRQI